MIMDRIAMILTVIGGLNWGSVGIFRFDFIAWLCGGEKIPLSAVSHTSSWVLPPYGAFPFFSGKGIFWWTTNSFPALKYGNRHRCSQIEDFVPVFCVRIDKYRK